MKAGTLPLNTLLICLLFLTLAGCGGGGGNETTEDKSENEALARGIFVDAGVSGLTYRSGPAVGQTDASGAFRYQVASGEPQFVTFSLGEMELGSAIGRPVLTPVDILSASSTSDPRVINLLRLLQTLDEDGDPDNGIVLTESVQAQFTADTPLDLSTDIFDGSEPLATIFNEIGKEALDIVGPEEALEHFEDSILNNTERSLYTLGGVASGLLDSVSLVLGGETLIIEGDRQFSFIGKVFDGTAYSVTLEDSGSGQTCSLSNSSGQVDDGNISNIILQCTPGEPDVYPVGGSVSGLSGELRLVNNGADELTVTSDGPFQFATSVTDGSGFSVQVAQQPAGQTCNVAAGSGTISGAGVSSVVVSCIDIEIPLFTVSGEIVGLTSSIGLSLNGGESVSFTGTSFMFPTGLEEGSDYTVTIANQPAGQQGCAIANATGTIATSDIDDVRITCATSQFSLGGAVTGLSGALTLNNGGDSLQVSGNGSFAFAETYVTGTDYNITIGAQPEGQTCSLASASGTFSQQNVTDVSVTCSDSEFSVAGSATGIPDGESLTVVLERRRDGESNFGNVDTFELTTASSVFSSQLAFRDDYRLTVDAQPVSATCLIDSATSITGDNIEADVIGLDFSCQADTYDVTLNIAATGNQGLPLPLTDLLSEGGELSIAVDGQTPLELTTDETSILSGVSYPDAGYELRLTDSLVAANCSLVDEDAQGALTILSSPVDKTNTGSNAYDLQVDALCAEKPQFSLSFLMEGVDVALIANPSVTVAINEEEPLVVTQGTEPPALRTFYSGSELGVQLSETLDGYGCAFTSLQAGETGTTEIDPPLAEIETFSIGSDLQYGIGCEGDPVPLNLVTSGIDKPFDVVLQVEGGQQSVLLDPVSKGATLLPVGNVAVGASLESLSFANLPTGIASCVLSDQTGLVSGGVLSGIMPLDGASLIATCSSVVSVATAVTGDELITDPALRACIQESATADQGWESVTQLSCPYEGDGDRISSLEGIERFVNLTEINFNDHDISNLDPLLALLNLEAAFLANNPLTVSEREKLNALDELNQTVFLSGSGTVADAGPQFFDVNYDAMIEIEDSEIYILSGQRKEFAISYGVTGCSESQLSTFDVRSRPVGDSEFLNHTFERCGFSSSSVFVDGDPFFSREAREVEFDFIFGGNVFEQDLADQLYANFEFVPVLIPEDADSLDELLFADADMAGCLADLVGSGAERVVDIQSLNLSECITPPADLAGIEQLKALEFLDVGGLSVSSTGLLSELVFLDSFSRSTTTPLSDVSWRNSIRDDQLLTCLNVAIAANFDENNAANSPWQNWEDVTRVECPSPLEQNLFSAITDLGGIEQFEQLTSLTFPGHPIVDGIGALRRLPVLTELELAPSIIFEDEWAFSAGQSATSRRNPRYKFALTEPQSVAIELASTLIDPYLIVLDDSGNEVASTDEFENLNTTISILLEPGDYEVVAATYFPAQTGSFQISANTNLAPVLRKLKTPILADDPESPGSFGLNGTVEGAQEEPSLADVEIGLEMLQPVVFFNSGNTTEINLNVTASVERSDEGGGGSGIEQFVAYAYRFTVNAVNASGQTFSSAPRTCNTDFSEASISCLQDDIDLRSDIADMALVPGEYKLTVDYEAVYDILDRASQTIAITAPLVVFPSCLPDESGALSGSFSSIDFSACPDQTEIDISGINMLSQLQSLDLSNMIVTAGMSDLLRVQDGAQVVLDGLVVDLSKSSLLAEFIPDPALRQCVSDQLPEFYEPAIDTVSNLNCSGYGIYHLGGLEYLQTLRSVDISDNLLEDDDVQVLKRLPLLAGTVDVTGNDLSFAAIAELQTYFAGKATFLPAGPVPVVPVPALTTSNSSFEVSWVTDPTVTRYDLLYRFEGENFDRTVTNVVPPVAISFPGGAIPYEVQLVVTNDLGSASGARVEGTP